MSAPKDEPDPAHRVQDARLTARLELAAQVADEDVGDVRPRVEGVAPDLLVQPAAIDDLVGVVHEEAQQLELAAGEVEVAIAARGAVGARVEAQVAGLDDLVLAGRAAAQQRVQARSDLRERERLDHVVVGAGLQAADAVVDLVARGEHADRHFVAGLAQALEHLEAVEVGHAQVQEDDGGVHPGGRFEPGAPARGRHDGEALELEAGGDGAADGRVVIHQQDDRAGSWRVTHG
jgi:hypothetical protein